MLQLIWYRCDTRAARWIENFIQQNADPYNGICGVTVAFRSGGRSGQIMSKVNETALLECEHSKRDLLQLD
jgi:hypothetical protein